MLEYRACSLSYFLDEMQGYELKILLDSLEYTYKQEWEQTRLISYVIAQTQSTKRLKPTDILKFHWDKDKIKSDEPLMTKADVDRLTMKMNQIVEENKKQKNG